MLVNAVKIRPIGAETTWAEVGYAFLVSLAAQSGTGGPAGMGEIVVAANEDGLTVTYEKDKRTYELKLKLTGDAPEITQEDITPPKKLW